MACLRLVKCFDAGEQLLEAAERHHLEGILSKRKASPYRSGECRDWGEDQDEGLARGEPRAVAAVTKVEAIDDDVRALPDLINAGFKMMDSRFFRLMPEMDRRFDATLRAIAEMIAPRSR